MVNINRKMKLLVAVFLLSSCLIQVLGQDDLRDIQQRNPRAYQNFEILDGENGNYILEWVVDWRERKVHFDVTVKTIGYVAFGLSADGDLEGADIVIGGVTENGTSYFSDRHGHEFGEPEIDASQDWQLESASENRTHTFLSFSRAFDTCDDDDYLINEDTVVLTWAYGRTDDSLRNWDTNRNRGEYAVHLLNPNVIPRVIKEYSFRPGTPPRSILRRENLDIWTISSRTRIPAQETEYLCTIHRAPRLGRKHHIVGFHARLETEEARRHTHHLLLYRCYTPPGTERRIFERFVNTPGQTCFLPEEPTGSMPTQYCSELVNGYGIGGRLTFFPDHTGQSFAESENEYYLLQVHYDNPDRLTNLEYTVNLDMYYTSVLRPNELGLIAIGHVTPGSPSLLIPPQSPDHQIFSHCSTSCTEALFPPEGIKVFMSILHTHYSGRKARVRHFRGDQELPWINEDSNYDPFFQNFRMLNGETTIMPGDQITTTCEYDNTWTNGTTVGGLPTTQEMCISFFYYYNKVESISMCRSQIEDPYYWRRYLGVNNITWDESQLDFVATSPRRLTGMTMARISDTQVRWTQQLRNELQEDHRSLPQVSSCPRITPTTANGGVNVEDSRGPVTLPRGIFEYRPPGRSCGQSSGRGQPNRLNNIVSGNVQSFVKLDRERKTSGHFWDGRWHSHWKSH